MSYSQSSLISRLNDSHLVAKIQNYFGIQLHDVVKSTGGEHLPNEVNTKNKRVRKINMLDDQKCLYSINNPLFYWFFMVTTHMGNEIFYIIFLPIMAWNYSDKIMYLTCIAWALCMYIGQATKDILKIPRPLTPPVVKLEEKYLLEYGFPSTHAMAAVTISYSLLTFMPEKDLTTEVKFTAFMACFFICLSRVYLGMHSFFDILGGILYAYVLSYLFALVADAFYSFSVSSLVNGALMYILMLLMCLAYPCKTRWSSARSDTFLIQGAAAGLIIGMSLKSSLDANHIGKSDKLDWLLVLKRSLVGIGTVLVARQLSKLVLHKLIRVYLKWKWPTKSITDLKSAIRENFTLDLLYYFITYSNISLTAIFSCFFIYDYFKLI